VGSLPTAPSGNGAQNAHPTTIATGQCLGGLELQEKKRALGQQGFADGLKSPHYQPGFWGF